MRRIHSGRPARARVLACSSTLLLAVAAIAVTQTAANAEDAHSATVQAVSVRVEGPYSTLVPPTIVTLHSGAVSNDGVAADSCSGLSALGALQDATKGDWKGSWSSSYSSYFITTIRGVDYPSSASYYWSFWVNNKPASDGACGVDPKPGSSILFFPQYDGSNKALASPSVLGVSAPATALINQRFTVTVSSYANSNGKRSLADGAHVSGGGHFATTAADGEATLSIGHSGTITIDVDKHDAIRTETTVCVHAPGANTCGTSK
jgi:hypothetical protein